jgi:acetyl esterase/lipase
MVQIGKREILHQQVMAFSQAMREAGVAVQSIELERLWHVGQAEAGLLAEAHQAVQQLGGFLRKQLERQPAA